MMPDTRADIDQCTKQIDFLACNICEQKVHEDFVATKQTAPIDLSNPSTY